MSDQENTHNESGAEALDTNALIEQRRSKLSALREAGQAFPNDFRRDVMAGELHAEYGDKDNETLEASPLRVKAAGRMMSRRVMGKNSFAHIRDMSGQIQLFVARDAFPEGFYNEEFKKWDIGDIVGAEGVLFKTKMGELSIKVDSLQLLTKSLRPLPEKWHGLADVETRYRQRYLDLIANAPAREVFQVRSRAIAAIRQFLNRRGFIEVETPVLQPSAGGALASPFTTHHNALDQDFYLRIALELHLKRLVVGGFDKVYEIGRIFRNEGVSTQHHPEFTMLESYQAYADYNDVMAMLEEMVSSVSQEVLGTTKIKFGEDNIDFKPPWKRLTLRQAVEKYSGIDFVKYPTADGLREKMRSLKIEVDPQKNWAKLVDELIKDFVRPKLIQPTIIFDYPLSMSPLAKTKPGEERVVERFQAIAGGLEIANAYTELNDPLEQRERFEEQLKERAGDDKERWSIDEDYLLALEYGMPPAGGLGVGIDRLIMLLTNQPAIRVVILFPQLREK